MIGDQNSPENLRLLAAQRQIYIDAKSYGKFRFWGSLAFAVVGPLAAAYCAGASIWVLLLSSIAWPIMVEIFKVRQKTLTSRAATIQEEFDVNMFGLPWNHILVGNKIAKEIIIEADRQFRGDKKDLQNWYPVSSQEKGPLDILVKQRTNLLWDRRLRIKYARLLGLVIASVFVVEVCICIYREMRLLDWLIQYFAPLMPLILLGIENILTHYEIAGQKKQLEDVIMSIYEKINDGLVEISFDKEYRQIQDAIYSTRRQTVLVPEFWSNRLSNSFQSNMIEAAREYQNLKLK